MTDVPERWRTPEAAIGIGRLAELPSLLVHLRPHWQLVLSPLFLWGVLLAGGALTPGVGVAFVAVHLFLYGGVTAYNSAYDRDTGPVSGLYRPPQVTAALLPFAVLVQLLGLGVASLLDLRLAAVYVAYMGLSVLYSHPRLRWKASPPRSALIIFVGQGMLGFAAGWIAAGGPLGDLASPEAMVGMLGGSLVTLALFPLGHLFQLEEDRQRGDRSVALALGVDRTFRFAQAALFLSAAMLGWVIATSWGWRDALVVAGGVTLALATLEVWRRRFASQRRAAVYRTTMAFQAMAAAGFAAFLLLKLY